MVLTNSRTQGVGLIELIVSIVFFSLIFLAVFRFFSHTAIFTKRILIEQQLFPMLESVFKYLEHARPVFLDLPCNPRGLTICIKDGDYRVADLIPAYEKSSFKEIQVTLNSKLIQNNHVRYVLWTVSTHPTSTYQYEFQKLVAIDESQ